MQNGGEASPSINLAGNMLESFIFVSFSIVFSVCFAECSVYRLKDIVKCFSFNDTGTKQLT